MQPPAREQLVVFVDGDEVPGISVYGLWPAHGCRDRTFPLHRWPADTRASPFRLHGAAWESIVWDVALAQWPHGDEWLAALRGSLSDLVHRGAVVAWVGTGTDFCDPPELFAPQCMTGGVLVALTSAGAVVGELDPDVPLRPIDDAAMLGLRAHARGLADVD